MLRIFALIAAIVAVCLVAGSGGAAGGVQPVAAGTSAAGLPWKKFVFDGQSNVGRVALTSNGVTGRPQLAYYNVGTGNIVLAEIASYSGHPGNCGPGDGWYCSDLATRVNSNLLPSAAALSAPGQVWIQYTLYYSSATHMLGLRTAKYEAGALDWEYYRDLFDFDDAAWGGTLVSPPSVAIDQYHYPHVAVHVQGRDGIDRLLYIGDDSSGMLGTCAQHGGYSGYNCEVVASAAGAGFGMFPSIATVGQLPRIAYYDGRAGVNDLKFAYRIYPANAGMANCNATDDYWRCITIETSGDTGKFASLATTATSQHIAFYNYTTGNLRHARYVGSGGNCGLDPAGMIDFWRWQCDDIAPVGTGLAQVGLSLKVDAADRPVIAYMDATSLYKRLRWAQPAARLGEIDGNCGPVADLLQTWRCSTLDSSAYDEGEFVSLALDPSGRALVAYTENTGTETILKLMYQEFRNYLPLAVR